MRKNLVIVFLIGLLISVVWNSNRRVDTLTSDLHYTQDLLVSTSEKLSATNEKLTDTSIELTEANRKLEAFTKPIAYDRPKTVTYNIPLSDELQQYTYDTCIVYGIEEYYETILAVMWRESNFDPTVVSATDDYGLMQINRCNHAHLMSMLGLVDIMNPRDNIEGGVYIFATLLSKYETMDKVLMAYNMGEGGAAAQWERGNYSSAYSRDVLAKAKLIESDKYSEK